MTDLDLVEIVVAGAVERALDLDPEIAELARASTIETSRPGWVVVGLVAVFANTSAVVAERRRGIGAYAAELGCAAERDGATFDVPRLACAVIDAIKSAGGGLELAFLGTGARRALDESATTVGQTAGRRALVLGAREERHAALALDTHLAVSASTTRAIAVFALRADAPVVSALEVSGTAPTVDRSVDTAAGFDGAALRADTATAVRFTAAHEHSTVGTANIALPTGRALDDALTPIGKRAALDVDPDGRENWATTSSHEDGWQLTSGSFVS